MNTHDFEVHRAIVHYSNTETGEAQVRVPALLGVGEVVNIPTVGLTNTDGFWNVPSIGSSLFIAVSTDRTQFLWLTAVGISGSSGDDPSNEPIGHEDRTGSRISFNNSTRTFTIQPAADSYVVWCVGQRHVKTVAESVQLPNTTGLYYIAFDATGTLNYHTEYFDWPTEAPTSYVYWNAATQRAEFFSDERHGVTMDWATHEYLHRTRGAVYANGFDASNFIVGGDGSLDSHAKLDIDNGTFFDEDLQVDIRHSLSPAVNTWEQQLQGPARIPVFYRSGTGYVYDAPTDFPVKQGTAHPVYNSVSGGSWGTTELGANSYGVQWIVATNQLNYPVLSVMGQQQYANIGQAEAASWADMDLEDLPIVEIRVLYKIIFRATGTNDPGCTFVQIADYRTALLNATSTAASVVDHGNLTGLADDDHPQYAFRNTSPTITLSGDVTGSVTLTDLGSGTLTATVVDDSHTHDTRYYTETESDALFAPATSSPTITLAGDATGSVTLTNLGDGTLTVTVANDSHTHDTRYYTESESDSRFVNVTGDTMTGNLTLTSASLITNNSSPTIYFQDTDHRSAMIHVNSNIFYVLRGSGTNSLSWATTGGRWPLEINLENNNATFGNVIYSHSLRGHSNVAGTGEAIHTPAGIYSTGTNWLYGTILTNGNNIGATTQYVGAVYANNWFRSSGQTGWYSETYNGGIYMTDSTWVRTYNSKNLYSNNVVRAGIQLQTEVGRDGNVGQAALNLGMGNGSAAILAFNPVNFAPLITCGQGEILYVRNYLNNNWATLQGYLVNHSSVHSKTSIHTLGDSPLSAGAMGNTLATFDAMEAVRKLRPVSYYWHEQDALPRMPVNEDGTPNQRRIDALTRLNKLRNKKGLGNFTSDELKHVCGRDCEKSQDDPCWRFKNYITGKVGFISQEVGEVLPQAAELSESRDEYESIDTLALVAVLTKAIQEIDKRLSALEAS